MGRERVKAIRVVIIGASVRIVKGDRGVEGVEGSTGLGMR